MLKESILFVASMGVLIYLMAPSGEPPEAEPVAQTEPETVKTPARNSDHGWDSDGSGDDGWGDEDEVDEENFTFGDPTTVLEGGDDDGDQEESASRIQPSAKSPGSDEAGSIYNPITVAPRDLPDPNVY